MTTLAFDGQAGTSGDLLLGALLAAGADRDALSPVEDALDVRYAVERVEEAGIAATRVRVLATDDETDADDHGSDHGDGGGHDHADGGGHDHAGYHEHADEHDHSHDADVPAEGHGPTRSYVEVVDIVESLDLPDSVETDALATVELLGQAEASVHGTDLESTHFHEVGADDAIADVVGVALLIDDLDVDRVVTTPVRAGGGEVEASHGTYPVPPPAVVELAERADWELVGGPVDRELLTPTGAAILAHHAEGVDRLPPLRVEGSGYGAGGYDLGDRPNVLRATVGEGRGSLECQPISVLETNVDDVSPEVLGDLQDSLADVGAKDVTVVPTTMKKSRPGHLVKVIVDPGDAERVARRLAAETGTLGVREAGAGHRFVAERSFETATVEVETGAGDGGESSTTSESGDAAPSGDGVESGDVAVKVATDAEGALLDVSAEYDDAAALARRADVPVREVQRRAEGAVRERLDADAGGTADRR